MRQRAKAKVWLIVLIMFLVLVVLYSGFRILEPIVFTKDRDETDIQTRVIERNGVKYYPRQDITAILLMGIDQSGAATSSGVHTNPGAADMLGVAVFDETDKSFTVLALNRDTMTHVPVLGINGRPAGTAYQQLALAHTYGSGLADSAENTREAVSKLLYGIALDYYVSLRMDGLAAFNDAVGGVTVNVVDDFSAVDATIPQGEVTLRGAQAIRYVQSRSGVGDQLNVSRMARQEAYMAGFMKSLKAAPAGWEIKAYENAKDYLVTDCSQTTMSNLLSRYKDYTFKGTVTSDGENVKGEEYMEFHLDQEAMDALVLKLFYAPVK